MNVIPYNRQSGTISIWRDLGFQSNQPFKGLELATVAYNLFDTSECETAKTESSDLEISVGSKRKIFLKSVNESLSTSL